MEREQVVSNSAILLTPRPSAGGSAIAVVRIRGLRVLEFLRKFFSRPPSPGLCVHGELRDGQSIIDDCLVVLDRGGHWADICLHGGAWVIESTLKLARREGFAIIDPALPIPSEALDEEAGELEREVLQYLPLALTEPAIRMLLNQPAAWRAEIDPPAILKDMTLWRLLHPPKIAIVGEPNVGKSTLANRLFGQQRSITADVPGTTRDWVGEMADIRGLAAMLIDTPGLHETDDPIERSAIAAGGEKIREADLLIEVLDATGHAPRSLPKSEELKIIVINKIDQPAGWDASAVHAIRISAKTGQGCDEFCGAVHLRLGIGDLNPDRPRWWTERQRGILRQGAENPAVTAKLIAGE
jgi:small GTP-binding protein